MEAGQRISVAEDICRDRACQGGGWNVGNAQVSRAVASRARPADRDRRTGAARSRGPNRWSINAARLPRSPRDHRSFDVGPGVVGLGAVVRRTPVECDSSVRSPSARHCQKRSATLRRWGWPPTRSRARSWDVRRRLRRSRRRIGSESRCRRPITRRDFLAASAMAAVMGAGCRRRPYRSADFAVPAESPVMALAAASYDVDFAELIGRGLRELQIDVRGKHVLLKPNLVEYEPGTVINTHPHVVLGAAVALPHARARARSSSPKGRATAATSSTCCRAPGMLPLLTGENGAVRRPEPRRRAHGAAAQLGSPSLSELALPGRSARPTWSCRCPS